jgi:hypothetical protein
MGNSARSSGQLPRSICPTLRSSCPGPICGIRRQSGRRWVRCFASVSRCSAPLRSTGKIRGASGLSVYA